MIPICAPAIVYLFFSIIQITIDVVKKNYSDSIMKLLISIPITYLLNYLCKNGYETVSWVFVLIPFLFMIVVIASITYVFGIQSSGDNIEYIDSKCPPNVSVDDYGNIIVNDPYYDYIRRPAFYKFPNIIIPTSQKDVSKNSEPYNEQKNPPNYSSETAYVS
tara:strand:+ start:2066 stop:2551 length:486 start_codon:yes stop_codon:yes gene_type:complete